jgi:hypothetical protein
MSNYTFAFVHLSFLGSCCSWICVFLLSATYVSSTTAINIINICYSFSFLSVFSQILSFVCMAPTCPSSSVSVLPTLSQVCYRSQNILHTTLLILSEGGTTANAPPN